MKHAKPIQRRDYEYLASVTKETPKVTIPSPTMLHFRAGREGISEQAYPDLADFFADVGAALGKGLGLVQNMLDLDAITVEQMCETAEKTHVLDDEKVSGDFAI